MYEVSRIKTILERTMHRDAIDSNQPEFTRTTKNFLNFQSLWKISKEAFEIYFNIE